MVPSHAGGHWFESSSLHQKVLISQEIRTFLLSIKRKSWDKNFGFSPDPDPDPNADSPAQHKTAPDRMVFLSGAVVLLFRDSIGPVDKVAYKPFLW